MFVNAREMHVFLFLTRLQQNLPQNRTRLEALISDLKRRGVALCLSENKGAGLQLLYS